MNENHRKYPFLIRVNFAFIRGQMFFAAFSGVAAYLKDTGERIAVGRLYFDPQ